MTSRLRYLLDQVLTSYWFVPGIMVSGSILIAAATVQIDMHWHDRVQKVPWLLVDSENAGQVLAVIAGSMITITGVVYSMTLVALSLAASQYGAKLLRQFMKARANQVVLGMFTGTFVYSVLVLRMVNLSHGELHGFVPHLSTHIAILAALFSLGSLIFFIHDMSRSMQADSLIAAVAAELDNAVMRWTKDTPGDKDSPLNEQSGDQENSDDLPFLVHAPKTGYVQSIDYRSLVHLCRETDTRCSVLVEPGQFVMEGQGVIRYGSTGVGTSVATTAAEANPDFNITIIVGTVQTPLQDIEYGIDQLVQLGVRALSPGINDPLTAMTCTDWLVASLVKIGQRNPLPARYYDDDNILRVRAQHATCDDLADRALNQIRHYGTDAPQMTLHVVSSLVAALELIGHRVMGKALLRHASEFVAATTGERYLRNDHLRLRDLLDRAADRTHEPAVVSVPSLD